MIDSLSADQREAILTAIYARRKIEAIKLVREAANCGLAEAKEFVEKYSAELEAKNPEKFASSGAAKGKGCSAVFVMLMLIGIILFFTAKAIARI
ncbi:MAG: hypothetical protein JWM68_1333 [Verrucomicrobiales bacterium]|nr:hypothetical protein [Verrucomicrobiales bacterium]